MAATATKPRRSIGIVPCRRSGREGDPFASPAEQRERIEVACEHDGLTLLRIEDEPNVSGGTALQHRDKLRRAVEAVEARVADVIVVAYFDRLVRSLQVQGEVVDRVPRS